MHLLYQIFSLVASLVIALLCGKLVSRFKLPSILGWLIAGMALGPHAMGLLSQELLDTAWFNTLESLLECIVGLIIGTELIWRQLKRAGTQILVTTITESLGTFVIVSLVFGLVFYFTGIPVYLALIFGGISLATAPAPSLSIVNEMKTSGPVTQTLLPMAALDDLVGALVFFGVMAFVSAGLSSGEISILFIIALVFSPVLIGALMGYLCGLCLRRMQSQKSLLLCMLGMLFVTAMIGFTINHMIGASLLNFMLLGMAFSTVFANMISDRQLYEIMQVMNPVISLSLVVVILNLGAPLDYHLVTSAGLYTVIYILSRAVGKYSGAYLGARLTHAPDTVRKYLGFTLLPHSGVSLVFTGVAVSFLGSSHADLANIIQGTIAAAAVINEIIAVFMAKKGFEWAGEIPKKEAAD